MKIIINHENFRPKMALDLENYRGKYVCAQEILILDWRLRRGDIYEVSGDIKYYDFAFDLILSFYSHASEERARHDPFCSQVPRGI